MLKETEDGPPVGIAMARDPNTQEVIGVERCPDCAWDCRPTVVEDCGAALCNNGSERAEYVTANVNVSFDNSDFSIGCVAWGSSYEDQEDHHPCGDYFNCGEFRCQSCNSCTCANGTWVLGPVVDNNSFPRPSCGYATAYLAQEGYMNCCTGSGSGPGTGGHDLTMSFHMLDTPVVWQGVPNVRALFHINSGGGSHDYYYDGPRVDCTDFNITLNAPLLGPHTTYDTYGYKCSGSVRVSG